MLATTLLDMPAKQTVLLYEYRWEIELNQPDCPSSGPLYRLVA